MQKITFRKVKNYSWQHALCNNYILCIDGKKTRYYIYKSNINPAEDIFSSGYQTCHLLNDIDDYGYESVNNDEGHCRFDELDQAKRFLVEYLNREPYKRKDIF